MSRDNRFELTARCGSKLLDNQQFIPAFQKEINDKWDFDPFETSWSWYDCGKHLHAVAKQFPDVLFKSSKRTKRPNQVVFTTRSGINIGVRMFGSSQRLRKFWAGICPAN